jgi:hypothetical protein
VKWLPYSHKAILASANHSIGHSILMGDASEPPPVSSKAALDYSWAYGKPSGKRWCWACGASRAWLFPHMGIAVGNELHWLVMAQKVFSLPTLALVGAPVLVAGIAAGLLAVGLGF